MIIEFTDSEIREILRAEAERRLGIHAEIQSAEDGHFVVTDEHGDEVEGGLDVEFRIQVTIPTVQAK